MLETIIADTARRKVSVVLIVGAVTLHDPPAALCTSGLLRSRTVRTPGGAHGQRLWSCVETALLHSPLLLPLFCNQSDENKPTNPSKGPRFTFKVNENTKIRTLIYTKSDQEVKIVQTQLVSPEVKAPSDSDNLVKTDSVEHNPSPSLSLSPVTDQTSTEPTTSESPYKNNYSTKYQSSMHSTFREEEF